MKFTNVNVLKEEKRMKKNLIIGVVLGILAIVFFVIGGKVEENNIKNAKDLHSIIISKDENKDGVLSYIDAKRVPLKFAGYDDTTDAYYLISDGEYLYIIYMSEEEYKKVYNEDNMDDVIRITGVTELTTKDVKSLAIDAYNDLYTDKEDQISIADFDDYFGTVYLNMTKDATDTAGFEYLLGAILLVSGTVVFIVGILRIVTYKNKLKKLDEYDISKVDKEMNNPESFYYESSRLYLTPNYIVNFGFNLDIIKYDELIWMYPTERRVNGIKASKSIVLQDKYGKYHTIASIDIITKAKKEEYEEIWNTISNKNDKLLLGYNKENINKSKEITKNIIK